MEISESKKYLTWVVKINDPAYPDRDGVFLGYNAVHTNSVWPYVCLIKMYDETYMQVTVKDFEPVYSTKIQYCPECESVWDNKHNRCLGACQTVA